MQDPSVDEILRALADERRRSVIRYLMNDPEGVASYREVAEHIDSHCRNPPTDVMSALHHAILPTLADSELLEYDPETELVQYRPDAFAERLLNDLEGP